MPPLACSKRPWVRVGGAGEGAALVAEQLAFNQLARDRRHVDRDERAGAPLAVVVQRAGDQFLAGAGLAVDHHRQVGGAEPRDGAVHLLHRRAAADQRQRFLGIARLRRGRDRGRRRGQRAPDDRQQFLQIERLGQVFEGATLGGLHRGHQGGLRAHDDHPQVGTQLADARDQVEAVLVRHDHVGDHQVAFAILHPAPQRGGIAGGTHLIARAAERLGQHGADGTVVVGDQDGGEGHGRELVDSPSPCGLGPRSGPRLGREASSFGALPLTLVRFAAQARKGRGNSFGARTILPLTRRSPSRSAPAGAGGTRCVRAANRPRSGRHDRR